MTLPRFKSDEIRGFKVHVDSLLGVLSVSHDGLITWDDLQYIKNMVWGDLIRAIEVYPAQADVVNSCNMRHLWRLGAHDFCPDLLGNDDGSDSLQGRHAVAWAEARG
ncbi:hypothetical protein SAMN04488041_103159 [Sulfitobacter pontiacus]|uniref:DUF7694 domain-containing protein n=1 Tax=Sulfitobacter pontiacus TaxID=60137 RepID=A0A1H2W793_9RHOB|nr:hypothetical protein [Sulfitobacter pontiacus]SDW75939.1 hypothetical protein SAMN04488041_103159 [Sulfitobacter pontiacus]